MHSEICPICKGVGEIPEDYGKWIGTSGKTKVCHGCKGKGWVSVKDEYQFVNPYIWPDTTPLPYGWETTDTTSNNDNVLITFEFSKKKK